MITKTGVAKSVSAISRLVGDVLAARDISVEVRRALDLSEAELQARGLRREDVVRTIFDKRFGRDPKHS